MQQITIRTHQPGRAYQSPHFYILNKGKNSGKPAHDPWVNCYVVVSEDNGLIDHYYWLSYALWKTGSYYRYLKGSVIEFITINDLSNALRLYSHSFVYRSDNLPNLVGSLQSIEVAEAQLRAKLQALNKLKKSMLHLYIKSPA